MHTSLLTVSDNEKNKFNSLVDIPDNSIEKIMFLFWALVL